MTNLQAEIIPTGTITFLFTDIEGSTRLWEEKAEAMKPVLARHDAILRKAVESNQGYLVKSTAMVATLPSRLQRMHSRPRWKPNRR